MLTYERSSKLRGLARELPLDAIVIETDAPNLTVASHRGERNSPAYLPECLAALAALRDEDPAEHAAASNITGADRARRGRCAWWRRRVRRGLRRAAPRVRRGTPVDRPGCCARRGGSRP